MRFRRITVIIFASYSRNCGTGTFPMCSMVLCRPLWIYPDSHHRIIPESAPQSAPLEFSVRTVLGGHSYNEQHLMDLVAHGCNILLGERKSKDQIRTYKAGKLRSRQ